MVASDLADAVFSAARFSPELETGGIASAFMIPEENIPITIDRKPSTLDRYLPEDVRNGLSKATIMIAGQPCDREMLPDTVTTDRTKFMDGLKANGHTAVVDHTSGPPVYLFLDMHGENDHPVRVIFDTGASISLWTASAVKDGRL